MLKTLAHRLNHPTTVLFFVIGPFALALLGLAACTAVPAAAPDDPAPAGVEIPPSPAQPPTTGPVLPQAPTLPPSPTVLTTTIYIVQFKQDLDARQQTEFITAMEQRLRRPVEVLYRYETAYHGLAVILTPQEAQQVADMAAVRQVQPDYKRSSQDRRAVE